MPETLDSRALRAVSDAVVTIAAEHRFEPVLEKLAEAARQLAAARYAAIGVPDGEGGFSHFITSGMSQKQYDAIGDLPRQHGLLGAMLETPRSQRFPNIQEHPRFEGWPDPHPSMRSFLGVPIVSQNEVIGSFYLTDKKGERGALFDGAEVDPALEREVFRVTQEAIGNALKHARPEHVRVEVRRAGHRLVVTVEDDGSGFDPEGAQARRHLGLISMRERAESIGGELRVRSAPGEGTTVWLEVNDPRPHR